MYASHEDGRWDVGFDADDRALQKPSEERAGRSAQDYVPRMQWLTPTPFANP